MNSNTNSDTRSHESNASHESHENAGREKQAPGLAGNTKPSHEQPHGKPPVLWMLVPVALLIAAFLAAR